MDIRRVSLALLGAAGALAALVTVGGGWIYSSQLLPAPSRDRTLDVTATLTPRGTVLLPPDRRACLEQFGLLLADDSFLVYDGEVVSGSCTGAGTDGLVERSIDQIVRGAPPIDQPVAARFDEYIVGGDPSDVGVEFAEIEVPVDGGLPSAPAWLVEGGDDWVIAVHGRSGTRAESLRLLPTLAAEGYSVMAITHRNDRAGGPDTDDAIGRFGQSEWVDLQAAVEAARERGARRVVLLGYSQGGSVISYYLRNVGEDGIEGVILDSPLLSLGTTLVQQARLRDIPDPLIPPILFGTRQFARVRAGFSISDVEHVDTLADTTVPMLLIHGVQDDFVPIGPSDDVAERRPEDLTFLRLPGAGHVEAWNTDRAAYADAVTTFLDSVFDPVPDGAS